MSGKEDDYSKVQRYRLGRLTGGAAFIDGLELSRLSLSTCYLKQTYMTMRRLGFNRWLARKIAARVAALPYSATNTEVEKWLRKV